jgi:hypothetical protein
MGRTRSREVEIFNFSFLDILACTIGLLIFIMVMVFILQSSGPVANTADLIQKKLSQAAQAQKVAAQDAQISDALEAALDRVQVLGEPDLKPQRDTARPGRDAAQSRLDQAAKELASAQSNLDSARLAQDHSLAQGLEQAKADLAAAQAAHARAESELSAARRDGNTNSVTLSPFVGPGQPDEHFDILHVDCQANQLILLKAKGGKIVEVGRTSVTGVADPQSDFQRLILQPGWFDHPWFCSGFGPTAMPRMLPPWPSSRIPSRTGLNLRMRIGLLSPPSNSGIFRWVEDQEKAGKWICSTSHSSTFSPA